MSIVEERTLAEMSAPEQATSPVIRRGRAEVLGFYVDKMTLDECVRRLESIIPTRKPHHVVLLNAAKVVKAQYDPDLADIIGNADLVGADGVPIVWASRILDQPLPGRVNGTDLMNRLIELSAQKGYRLYLLGAKQKVIERAIAALREQYPTIRIAGYRNGYFASDEEERRAVQEIAASGADILLVGMSSPMKEKWVRRHLHELSIPVIHGVGGSFDILSGTIKRAPKWMQQYGLEWFYRLCQEPGRMWKRYLFTNTVYSILVMGAVVKQLFGGKSKIRENTPKIFSTK